MFLYQYTPTSDLYLVSDVMQVDNTKLISADFNKCVQVGAKMQFAIIFKRFVQADAKLLLAIFLAIFMKMHAHLT